MIFIQVSLLILILILIFKYELIYDYIKLLIVSQKENFHDRTLGTQINSQPEILEDCQSCSFCDFNPLPQNNDYIISRCLSQHTQTNYFKPTNEGCRPHNQLSFLSGCYDGVSHYKQNIINLKNINDDNYHCKCNYSLDSRPLEQNPEKQSYESWISTLG